MLIIERVTTIMHLVQKESLSDLIIAFNKVEKENINDTCYLFYFDIEDKEGKQHEEKVILTDEVLLDLNRIYNILYNMFKKYN